MRNHLLSLLCVGLLVNSSLANTPNYLSQVAQTNGISTQNLIQHFKGGQSADFWPWIVWRDNEILRLRNQQALMRYLSVNDEVPFGLFGYTLTDLKKQGISSLVEATSPVYQAILVAKHIQENTQSISATAVSNDLDTLIHHAATSYGVDHALIRAVIKQESQFKPRALSHAGARGLMQIMPTTGADLGVSNANDLYTPAINIDAGTRYLKAQLDDFKSLDLALAAYNAGPHRVRQYGGVPPFKETKNYIAKVTQFYNQYRTAR